MTTFKRICIQNWEVTAENGERFEVVRGREYITSAETEGRVTVFSGFWVSVPISAFAGEERFTLDASGAK